MNTSRFLLSAAIAAAFTLLIAGSAAAALDGKGTKQLNECRYAASDVGKVAGQIGKRIESSNRNGSKDYRACREASARLKQAGSDLYFAINHADWDKLPNKAAGDKTRKAKDEFQKAYKDADKACGQVSKKEKWAEFKSLTAEYKRAGKQCDGVSTLMGK